jgi:hypothetical protein
MVLMVSSTDHITGVAGATLAVTVSKSGGAFASVSPTVVDRGSGWYSVALLAGDLDTLGDLALHASATGCDPADALLEVVAYDPQDAAGLGLSRIDAAVSTRALEDGGRVEDIHLDVGDIHNDVGTIDSYVQAIKASTDNLPASPAATGDAMALTAAAVDAILDEVIEGAFTLRQSIRLANSALFGKVSGAPTGPLVFRDLGDTKNRITGVIDTNGNRTTVSLDGS